MGYAARPMPARRASTVGLVGNDGRVDSSRVEALPGVAEIIHVSKPYKQVSREWNEENTLVTIAPGVPFGGIEMRDHRRSVLRGIRGADHRGGASRA